MHEVDDFLITYLPTKSFAVSDEDLGISVLFLYRAGHPPLKIPFEEIRGFEKTVLLPEVHYSFERVPNRTLKIRKGLAEALEKASGGRLTFERQG